MEVAIRVHELTGACQLDRARQSHNDAWWTPQVLVHQKPVLAGARYFQIFECGSTQNPVVCMIFKDKIHGARVSGLHSTDGLIFENAASPTSRPTRCWRGLMIELIVPQESLWNDAVIAHNLAILRLSEGEYLMMGGMQVFERKSLNGPIEGGEDPRFGVRLARGRGWPPRWNSSSSWAWPAEIVLHGTSPAGCVDRRPLYTAWPRLHACEFDGRLSLVRLVDGSFRLYARANLQTGAMVGGRYVQTSSSPAAEGGWRPWEPIRIDSLPASSSDIYFFVVQTNPVLQGTLLALFPVAQPPHACIAMAFSRDGVHFSKPVNLRTATLVWRTEKSDGTGSLEWRTGDHPVAGVLVRGDEAWFYVHHAVPGASNEGLGRTNAARSLLMILARTLMAVAIIAHL